MKNAFYSLRFFIKSKDSKADLYYNDELVKAIIVYDDAFSVIRYYLCTLTINSDNTIYIVVTKVLKMDDETWEYVEADDVYGLANATFTAMFADGMWTVTRGEDQKPEIPDEPADKLYTSFTDKEAIVLAKFFGFVIPFMPCNNYYFYISDAATICFEVDSEYAVYEYFDLYNDYTLVDKIAIDGGTLYYFVRDSVDIVFACYYSEDVESYVIDVYVGYDLFAEPDEPEIPVEPETPDEPDDKLYTSFTEDQEELLYKFVGFVVPFAPCDSYFYYDFSEENYLVNINFLVDSEAEFEEYLILCKQYELVDVRYTEEYGYCYYFMNNSADVAAACYYNEEFKSYVIDVYVGYQNYDEPETPDVPEIPGEAGVVTLITPEEKEAIVSIVKRLPEVCKIIDFEEFIAILEEEFINYKINLCLNSGATPEVIDEEKKAIIEFIYSLGLDAFEDELFVIFTEELAAYKKAFIETYFKPVIPDESEIPEISEDPELPDEPIISGNTIPSIGTFVV